jgi:hypothetical protein
LTLSFVFINIPGLFRKKAVSSQLSALSLRLSALVLTLDTWLLASRLFDLAVCFHRHSRFVLQESYQLSAISRQPSVDGLASDSRHLALGFSTF